MLSKILGWGTWGLTSEQPAKTAERGTIKPISSTLTYYVRKNYKTEDTLL